MNYLAFDLGAESGRAVLGKVSSGQISLTEVQRFNNSPVFTKGHWRWDVKKIYSEIKKTIDQTISAGTPLSGIGIDTWGVDFGLLDEKGDLLEDPITYRDFHTDEIIKRVLSLIPKAKIYNQTGIQFLPFNSLYQLYALKVRKPDVLIKSKQLLFMPDLFNYLLTKKQATEPTIASTSQLLDIKNGNWAKELFRKLGLPLEIMPAISKTGNQIGIYNNIPVFSVGSHDTASAVAGIPADKDTSWAFISSGTWSLVGMELIKPIISKDSLRMNWTNEKGVNNTFRVLKNISGLWLLKECKAVWEKREGRQLSYDYLEKEAERSPSFKCLINVSHPSFIHPKNMPLAITSYCQKTKQLIPKNKGEFCRCILESLSLEYKLALMALEKITEKKIKILHIVGGGSKNELLNQLTADATGKSIVCGPAEATAIGNLLIQAVSSKQFNNLSDGRKAVRKSFPLKTYRPKTASAIWQQAFISYNKLKLYE
jgi:rhamnulokinase